MTMRWSKFWWADYEADPKLRSCSLAAQGMWMRLLCLMHAGEPRGHLSLNGKAPTVPQIAAMAGLRERDVAKLLPELEAAGVFSRTDEGVIYSRRMLRDEEDRERFSQYGKKGGNPSLKPSGNGGDDPDDNGGVNPPHKLQEAEAKKQEAETELPPSTASQSRSPRGSRLPDDWHPELQDVRFASDLGLNPNAVYEQFLDYWHAKAGKDACKVNWSATWRNWCRREATQRKPREPVSKTAWVYEDIERERREREDRNPPFVIDPGRLLQ